MDLTLQIMNYNTNTSNISLPKRKKKKVIGLMKDSLGGKIIAKYVGLRAKTYSYVIDDGIKDKKGKGTKKFVIKRKLKFESYKNCLEAAELDNKINYLGKIKLMYIVFKKFIKNS